MNSEMVVVASDTTVSAESVTAGLCREPMEVRAESLPAAISVGNEDSADTRRTGIEIIEISSDEDDLDCESFHGLSSPVKPGSGSAVGKPITEDTAIGFSSGEDDLDGESFHGLSSPMKPSSAPANNQRTVPESTFTEIDITMGEGVHSETRLTTTESPTGYNLGTPQRSGPTTCKDVVEALDCLRSLLLQMISMLSGECQNPRCGTDSTATSAFPPPYVEQVMDAPSSVSLPPLAPAATLQDVLEALEQLRRALTGIIGLCEEDGAEAGVL